jgi:hypothetical protein
MANDKDLRELLELISSTRSMLENAKKNDRANNTLLKLFDNLSSSLYLYQHVIINLNDEIEQKSKQDSILLSEIEIKIDEMKSSRENIKNMLVDRHNSEVNAQLELNSILINLNQIELQKLRKYQERYSQMLKFALNEAQSYVKSFLEKTKSGKSLLPFLIDISSNMMGLISTSVAILKFIYDFLKAECSIWNNKFEDLEKNSGSIIGEIEGLISFLVIYSYNIITIYSNADSAIRKAEWIQLKREALPVVKMYIENYIPQKINNDNNDMENMIDRMKKFIQES